MPPTTLLPPRTATREVRAVVGESDDDVRGRLVHVLRRSGIDVVAAVDGAERLVTEAVRRTPDVIIAAARPAHADADADVRTSLALRRILPETGLLLLSQHTSRPEAMALLATGPCGVGYLRRRRMLDPRRFVADVCTVARSGTVVDPDLGPEALDHPRPDADPVSTLTPRQRHVLALMAEGLSNAAIARALFITEKSVVEHVSRVYDALDLPPDGDQHRRVLAVLRLHPPVTGPRC